MCDTVVKLCLGVCGDKVCVIQLLSCAWVCRCGDTSVCDTVVKLCLGVQMLR